MAGNLLDNAEAEAKKPTAKESETKKNKDGFEKGGIVSENDYFAHMAKQRNK